MAATADNDDGDVLHDLWQQIIREGGLHKLTQRRPTEKPNTGARAGTRSGARE